MKKELKISGGLQESGKIIGNTYNKYGSTNPLVRLVMRGFHRSLQKLVNIANHKEIHKIGCGEGYWVFQCQQQGIAARGSDFSK